MTNDLTAIRSLLYRYTEAQHLMQDGCSDGYCVVRRPRGMHTNGGCRCLYRPDHLTTQRAGNIMRLAQEMEATILSLCDEMDRLTEALEKTTTERDFFLSEVKLRNRIPSTCDTNADLLRRAEKAEAENERLRAALKPFVLYVHDDYRRGEGRYVLASVAVIGGKGDGWLEAEDFRRARAALAQKGGE